MCSSWLTTKSLRVLKTKYINGQKNYTETSITRYFCVVSWYKWCVKDWCRRYLNNLLYLHSNLIRLVNYDTAMAPSCGLQWMQWTAAARQTWWLVPSTDTGHCGYCAATAVYSELTSIRLNARHDPIPNAYRWQSNSRFTIKLDVTRSQFYSVLVCHKHCIEKWSRYQKSKTWLYHSKSTIMASPCGRRHNPILCVIHPSVRPIH